MTTALNHSLNTSQHLNLLQKLLLINNRVVTIVNLVKAHYNERLVSPAGAFLCKRTVFIAMTLIAIAKNKGTEQTK